jgi:sugar phosphate isomerase/epimerase
MPITTIERGVSTWSLHRTLGRFSGADSAIAGGSFLPPPVESPRTSLLDLLPELAARGYTTLHICHFHLESRKPDYLEQVRESLADAGISLDMLLIDDGDLTAPDLDRQFAWYDGWLNAAELLGAQRARICAGRSAPGPELLRSSGQSLALLAKRHPGVRVVTENWLELTPDAASMTAVLEAAGDDVGLLIDLGNWTGPDKYADLEVVAPLAESCHAKCHFSLDGADEVDYRRSLAILRDAAYSGPTALIYDGPDDDEWSGLEREWEIVTAVWNAHERPQAVSAEWDASRR